MKSESSRRSVISIAGLALVDANNNRLHSSAGANAGPWQRKKQTPDSAKTGAAKTGAGDLESEQGNTIKIRTASCNCGQLRVTVTGPDPERISMCHCKLCQKQSGSVFATQARFPREQVTIEGQSTAWKFPIAGAEPVPYRNCASGGGTFHFCPVCGSTVYYEVDSDAARYGIKTGTFADPTFPPPKISGFEEYRHPWAMNAAAVPMKHVD
jgi:hypothetical protein